VVALKNDVVMLVLCRKVIAKLLVEHITRNTCMEAIGVYEFDKARKMTQVHQPVLALVEIPERHGEPALDAFDVCEDIKEMCPGCKIMLMCPEKDKQSIEECVEAKKSGKIEDYIFYEASPEYLISKLKALLPL
jgi:response regulator RpfG family c-di-GMP phosphodiesterase